MSTHKQSFIFSFFVVIAIAILVRFYYAQMIPEPFSTADSNGYLSLGEQIIKNPSVSTIINEFRTPMYPIILGFVLHQYGSLNVIVFLQHILGIGTVILILLILKSFKVSPFTMIGVGIAVAINPLLFQWERFIMTESLAIFFVMLFFYFWVRTYSKLTPLLLIGMTLSGCIMILIRPATILIPFIPLLIRIIERPMKEKVQLGICITLIALVPMIYQMGNTVLHGYRGIQRAADLALFGDLLIADMDISNGASIPFFFDAVTTYKESRNAPNPFMFIDIIGGDDIYQNPTRMNELQQFTKLVLKNNIPAFIKQAVYRYPTTFFDQSAFAQFITYVQYPSFGIILLYWYATLINGSMLSITLLIPMALILFYQSRTRLHEAVVVGSFVIALQTAFQAAMIYEEWSRLNAIVIPITTMIFAFYIAKGVQMINMSEKPKIHTV